MSGSFLGATGSSGEKIMHKVSCIESCRAVDNAVYAVYNQVCSELPSRKGNYFYRTLMNVSVLGLEMHPPWVKNKEINFAKIMKNMLPGQYPVFQPQNLVVISTTRSKFMLTILCW